MGLNIGAAELSDQQTLDYCKGGASTYVILDNPPLAQRVHDQTGAIVISRGDWPDDRNDVPGGLVAKWEKRKSSAPDVHHYWPNEPGDPDLAAYIKLMDDCANAGVKACIGNFAWADCLEVADVDAGKWDDFIRAASAWTHAGHGVIGGHDYTSGALPWGCAGEDVMQMVNGSPGQPPGQLVGPDGWPDFKTIYRDAAEDWHLFRWLPLAWRAQKLGVEFFKLVLTECFWDRMEDLEASVLPTFDSWRGGKPANRDGLITQQSLFKHWWPQWTPLEATVNQLQWCEDTYSPHVVGFCMFAINRGAKWTNFNLERLPDLLEALPGIRGGRHV